MAGSTLLLISGPQEQTTGSNLSRQQMTSWNGKCDMKMQAYDIAATMMLQDLASPLSNIYNCEAA
eukprot:scaffold153410_cov42-Prasinocladus_malaysianus.AAC.1